MTIGAGTHPAVRAFLRAPSGWAATAMLLMLVAVAVLAPPLIGAEATRGSIMRSGETPSADFLLGTDMLGRSILARMLVATRLSLTLALAATLIAGVLGVALGVAVAITGPTLRSIGLRAIDVILGFPGILLAIVITAIVGVGTESAVFAIGIAYAPDFARLSSTLALSVTRKDFVAAAEVLGVGRRGRLLRYILPNIGDAMIVAVFATSAATLIAVSSLSFLGLGVQPPEHDWGRMLVEGVESFYETPLAALAPAGMIAVTGLSLGFFGEALARALNPVLWTPAEGGSSDGTDRRTNAPGTNAPETSAGTPNALVLEAEDLVVSYPAPSGGRVRVVDGVSISIAAGEIVGIVGESGSGKSQTALAIADLIVPPGELVAGRRRLLGHDLAAQPAHARRRLLGTHLAMVFQDPMTSLNPTLRVGMQVAEPAFVYGAVSRRDARARAVARLREVGIPAPERRLRAFPHEFSGGMQQRAMIAMGLVNTPALLIADEPTTALDVTIQAQILDLLRAINEQHGTAILLITHNLGAVAAIARRVLVMYAGRIVEDAPVAELLATPAHPYTRLLLASMPRLDGPTDEPLAAIEGQPPQPGEKLPGCAFAPRCPEAVERCRAEPVLRPLGSKRRVACILAVAGSDR